MIIEAGDLARRYGSGRAAVTALSDASFGVSEGEFIAIVGPSGSGKTTLMNILGLLDRPTSGSLAIAGTEVTGLSPDRLARMRNREIGFVFQSYNLLSRYTALENVELPLVYAGVRRRERRRRAAAVLESVGLARRAEHWPTQLSGGEQQRVAIARALVANPALLLADEPTGALDSRSGLQILALFQKLNRAGHTIAIVTHDADIASHAGRVLRLQDGVLVEDRPVAERRDARAMLEVPEPAGAHRQAEKAPA